MSDTTNITTTGKGVTPDSHSALFGLEGKRPSTTAGVGAGAGAGSGSGIIGTSGHAAPGTGTGTGTAGKASDDLVGGSDNLKGGINAQPTTTTAGIEHGGSSTAAPGSGAETLRPSQGSGEIPPKV